MQFSSTLTCIRLLPWALSLLGTGLAWGQTAAPSNASELRCMGCAPPSVHIHLEDSAASIDEVRLGGQTKRIEVQPKGGMPAYQVAPDSGQRSWQVLGF